MRVTKLLILALIIAISVTAANAQSVPETASQYAVDAWNRRASELRDISVADSRGIDAGQKAFFLSEIAAMTWDFDREPARALLADAAKSSIASLEIADDAQIGRRLAGATQAIATITRLDPELGRATMDEFADKSASLANVNVRSGDAWTDLAIFLADDYPKAAFAVGSKAILHGGSPNFYRLIGALYPREPLLAENLLELALDPALITGNNVLASRLALLTREGYRGATLSDRAKRMLLSRYADLLNTAIREQRRRPRLCDISVPVIYLTDEFERFLPERYTIVRAQTRICQAFVEAGDADIEKKFERLAPDELLRQARLTPDIFVKRKLLSMSFGKFRDQKLYAEGISALDDLADDERRAFGVELWRKWRSELTVFAAVRYLRDDDRPAFYKVVDRAPASVRATVRISLLPEILKSNDEQFSVETADDAFRELGNSVENGPRERASGFLALARHYVKLRASDADSSFRLAVKALNEVDSLNKDDDPAKEFAPTLPRLLVPYQLLEDDESGLLSVIKSVSNPRTRVRIELGLLDSVLARHSELMESSKPRRRTSGAARTPKPRL